MKAWEDLENDPHITICDTMNSRYYVNHGCKIEKFDDGRFEIKNTMTNSDYYDDIGPMLYEVFEIDGWLPGCYLNCINVYQKRANKVDILIQTALLNEKEDVAERLQETKQKLINKVESYRNKLSSL